MLISLWKFEIQYCQLSICINMSTRVTNEIWCFVDLRYVGAAEPMWRTLSFET